MSKVSPLVIGLGSTQQVGKDTLFHCFQTIDPRFTRFAFADNLRADLANLVIDQWDIDIWDMTPEEKAFVRPLLIEYGMMWRRKNPDHWVERVIEQILEDLSWQRVGGGSIPVITDVRFVNESTLLRRSFPGFKLICLGREGAPPPTPEEEKHHFTVEAQADLFFKWGNDTEEQRLTKARCLLESLGFK